jgi:hypothetical protein
MGDPADRQSCPTAMRDIYRSPSLEQFSGEHDNPILKIDKTGYTSH